MPQGAGPFKPSQDKRRPAWALSAIVGGSLLVLSGLGYGGWLYWHGLQAAAEATSAAQAAQATADAQVAAARQATSDAKTAIAAAAADRAANAAAVETNAAKEAAAAATDAESSTTNIPATPSTASSVESVTAEANINDNPPQAGQNHQPIAAIIVAAKQASWSIVDTQVEQLKMVAPLAHGDRGAARKLNAAGLAALQQHDYATAIQDFTSAKQTDPGDIEVRNNLGDAYVQGGKLDDAFSALSDTLMHSPDRSNAWQNLADAYAQAGRTDESAACVRLTLRYTRNRDKALAYLNSIVKANPSGAYPTVLRRVLADANSSPTVATQVTPTPMQSNTGTGTAAASAIAPAKIAQSTARASDAAAESALRPAEDCFTQQNYDCSLRISNEVLLSDPTNRRATELIDRSRRAQQDALDSNWSIQ